MTRNRTRPSTSQHRKTQRGYILMVVMILMVVLTSAGIYGLRAIDGDFRSAASAKRSESAAYAAEAGASMRMAELMLATEDAGAALDSLVEVAGWQTYPPVPVGNIPPADYQVVAEPVVAVEANPPPGVQVGSGGQITMWRIDSFAVTRTGGAGSPTSNSQRISVGMSMWSRGGMSYNIN